MPRKTKKQLKSVLFVILILVGIKIIITLLHFIPILFQLVFNRNIDLIKTQDQRVNILLLGIGGGVHEGPNLTDTIIFASINPGDNKTTLISIPRDLWTSDLNGKINTAYADGEEKKKGGGLVEAEAAVSKILGQQINYGIRIDFGGFVKAVNLVGGLDINVDNTLDDYAYPIEGKEDNTCGFDEQTVKDLSAQIATASASETDSFPCRYMHIHFEKGLQHLNGDQALEYVRSRHALGSEGTDFARSKRQQKVITALRDKLVSAQTIFDPAKLINLYSVIKDSIDTDIKEEEYDDFVRLAQKVKQSTIQSGVLDFGDEQTGRPGLLVNPPIASDYNFAWVLIPRKGKDNFSEVRSYVNCMISQIDCDFFHLKKTTP